MMIGSERYNTLMFEYFSCPHTTIFVLEPFWHIWKCESQYSNGHCEDSA